MGLPGFEPGLEDSESSVLAITPQALNCVGGSIDNLKIFLCIDRESNPGLVLGRHEFYH